MEMFSPAEDERAIEVSKRIKTLIGKGKDQSWLSREVRNVIMGYIQKNSKESTSKEKEAKGLRGKASYSTLDSSCDSYNEDGCTTSIEANEGTWLGRNASSNLDISSSNEFAGAGNNSSDDTTCKASSNPCGRDGVENCDSDNEKKDVGIIETTLHRHPHSPLGFRVTGGSDTPRKYICIRSLIPNTPAFNCNIFRKGDQLVMVGDICMIGLTLEEANIVLKQAPPVVKIIAQRKKENCATEGRKAFQEPYKMGKRSSSSDSMGAGKGKEKAKSVEPGRALVVDLQPQPGEMLGISITGGINDPYLKNIHVSARKKVKRLIPGGVADRDGRIEKGDRILSVNSHALSGLTKKEAAELLKEAKGFVVLVVHRFEDENSYSSPRGELHSSDTEETKEGADRTDEKDAYSSILSWVGKKVEKLGKLMGETTASLSSLGAFSGSKKPPSPQSSADSDSDNNRTLQLENECISSEDSEPNLPLRKEKPELDNKHEEEEQNQSSSKTSYTEVYNQSSSKTSYTEVYTSDGEAEDFRQSLNPWPINYRSLLNLNQGFTVPFLPKDFHIAHLIPDLSTSSMVAEVSRSPSTEEPPSTPSSEERDETLQIETPHAQQPTLKDTLLSLVDYSSERYHLQKSQGFSAPSAGTGVGDEKQAGFSSESSTIPVSTNYGHSKKTHMPFSWSTRHHHLPKTSSEDTLQDYKDVPMTPLHGKKRQYSSVNPKGEILTFRDTKSTLPRKISGNRDNLRLVELRKGAGWVGLQLEGGVHPNHMTEPLPITVGSLIRGGAAYRSGQIHEGDEILEVNGIPFANCTLREAVDIIRQQPPGNLILLLRETQDDYNYSCRRKLF